MNEALLDTFYSAFAAHDGTGMSACYHDDATFKDPVFDLRGAEIGAMWRMLCSRGKDLRIEATNLRADKNTGSADWQAWYSFSATGRAVHNRVQSRFRFLDGLIIEQVDSFAFWHWSRQALGPAGVLLGWTPWLRGKLQRTAHSALLDFMAKSRANP